MSEFLHMSGYAVYVWTSYAIGVASLLLNVWWARRNLARRAWQHGVALPRGR